MCLRFTQREFEIGFGLCARHRWEAIEEAIQRLARLEVVDERLDGHARPFEDERTADNIRITRDDLVEAHRATRVG